MSQFRKNINTSLDIFLLTSFVFFFFQFKWQSIIRPRYLTYVICASCLPEIFWQTYWLSISLRRMKNYNIGVIYVWWQPTKFIGAIDWVYLILHSSWLKVMCKFCSFKKILVSPSNKWKTSKLENLWWSFTHNKNNKGPDNEPCGTPRIICFGPDSVWPNETNWLLIDKKDESHSCRIHLIP